MIKKIKAKINQWKMTKAQKAQMKKQKKYFEYLRYGASFIKFIQQDLTRSKNVVNRHQRRRMEKTLRKGEITPEIVNYYAEHIDKVLAEMNNRLNPKNK